MAIKAAIPTIRDEMNLLGQEIKPLNSYKLSMHNHQTIVTLILQEPSNIVVVLQSSQPYNYYNYSHQHNFIQNNSHIQHFKQFLF